MKSAICIFALFISFIYPILAQQPEATKPAAKKKFPVFYEKVYLHTDREYYSTDDNIWFKAYMVNAISNIPMETSGSLYVDLISSDSKLITQKLIRLNKGLGYGDITLTDSIPGGTYKLRAYTNWMLNFGNIFVFEKSIKIHNLNGNYSKTNSGQIVKPTIQFFPESGSLIADVINTIAFKALNSKNKGCSAYGAVVSETNDTLAWFTTTFNGMGSFAFIPESNKKYYAVGTLEKTTFKTLLPTALNEGFGIQITDMDTASFFLNIITNENTLKTGKYQSMIINGLSHNKNCITAQVQINESKTGFRIPKRNFPAGIASFTLYDTLLIPHCQRLFYISKPENINLSVENIKAEYNIREQTILYIKTTNAAGLPVKCNLSISVTDQNSVPNSDNNILSYLNFTSEIRGNIEEPAKYFDPKNRVRFKQLDLLLLTQGWRDFLWRRIKDTTITVKHMVEPGICLSGKVRQKFADNPIPNANITAFVPKATKNSIFITKTIENGNYYLDGLEFYGKQKVIVNVTNEKGKHAGWIFLNPLDTVLFPLTDFYSEPDSTTKYNTFARESNKRKSILSKYTLQDTIHLEEVKVTAQSFKEEKQNREHVFQGGFADYDYKIGPNDYNYSLGQFLAMKVPRSELSSEPTEDGPAPVDRVLFRVNGSKQPPRFVLDGISMSRGDIIDENFIYNIPIENIERIMVSTTDVFSQAHEGFVISIFTNGNTQSKTKFYTITKFIEGYYEAQEFYAPVYLTPKPKTEKPDIRTTIYWQPNIQTNDDGECKLTFYNCDKATTVHYSIEGISENGLPIVSTGTYNVK